MATIKIEPFNVKTVGNYDATITGIYCVSSDCIEGIINNKTKVNWNISGICRDQEDKCNIRINDSDELRELVETIKQIVDKKYLR